ncbi:MAG: methyltransferase [Dehalococcoidia bacterium]
MPADALAPYVHREVALDAAGRRLVFATSLDLFSSHQVDVGSRLLLRTLDPVLAARPAEAPGARILDVGCGYGALGVTLAASPGAAGAHLVDRDALGVDFALENARRNGLEDRVTAAPGLGFDAVPEGARYDLVVSNVPGKAGEAVIASMLLGALGVLAPGGLVAVVVIEPIREPVAASLDRADIEVTLRRDTADYSVFHYRPAPGAAFPPPGDAFAAGTYDAATLTFEDTRGEPVSLATVQGLPGYDRVDLLEEALLRRLPALAAGARVLVSHPGQGVLPAAVLRACRGASLVLVDRDVLALRVARRALLALGAVEAAVEARVVGAWREDSAADARADLVLGVLHEGGGAAAVTAEYRGLLAAVAPGGRALLAGSSTAVTRLLALPLPAGLRAARTRHRGTSVLEVTRAANA